MAVASKYNKYPAPPPPARATVRHFAVAVHETDGVPPALVGLQDRFDLDVNVLLLAACVGAVRRQTLTAKQLGTARALVDTWHGEVVRPLRSVRRMLKSGPAPAPSPQTEQVRGEAAKAELDAELIELDVLGRWAAELNAAPCARPSTELAMAAMELAVGSYSSEPLGDDDRRALAMIAAGLKRWGGTDVAPGANGRVAETADRRPG